MATSNNSTPSQDFIPIEEIRDGVMILKDGSIRVVLLATSINFALKSTAEQESIIYQFQSFLNSLDFSVQMYIQSRKLDIRPYLALLEERSHAQTTDLMRLQINEYINFIKNLTEGSNIMTKSFFISIPYNKTILSKNPLTTFFGTKESVNEKNDNFEEMKSQIEQRVATVEQGLSRCGVKVIRLGSEELVELFYRIFNPGDAEKPIKM